MTITEHNLKVENERYKKALESIREVYGASARCIAIAALNPPPPPPATILELRLAAQEHAGSVELFGDGSCIWNGGPGETHSFPSPEAVLKFVKGKP